MISESLAADRTRGRGFSEYEHAPTEAGGLMLLCQPRHCATVTCYHPGRLSGALPVSNGRGPGPTPSPRSESGSAAPGARARAAGRAASRGLGAYGQIAAGQAGGHGAHHDCPHASPAGGLPGATASLRRQGRGARAARTPPRGHRRQPARRHWQPPRRGGPGPGPTQWQSLGAARGWARDSELGLLAPPGQRHRG
jgi:hypothetical protein